MQRSSLLDAEMAGGGREDEQEGLSVQSPCRTALSSASSLRKEQTQVDLEIKLLEALAIYPPAKLRGMHRHFVIYGIMEYLQKSFGRYFSPSEVLQLLDRFYDLEMLKPDEDDAEVLNQEEEFSLPASYFDKDESCYKDLTNMHRVHNFCRSLIELSFSHCFFPSKDGFWFILIL